MLLQDESKYVILSIITNNLKGRRSFKMSKNYDDYKPLNPMPPRRRANSFLSFVQYSIIILLVVALIAAGAFFMVLHNSFDGKPTPSEPIETLSPEESEEELPLESETFETEYNEPEEPNREEPELNSDMYTELQISKNDIHKGSLIFVGSNYKVVYPTEDLITLLGNKTTSYSISNNTVMVHKSILADLNRMMDDFKTASDKAGLTVWTAFRDEETQAEIYNDYVAKNGEEAAKQIVSKPGESDHNTGLGFSLKVFTKGLSYQLWEIDGYDWIQENCYKYGFVERYPKNKIDITDVNYSTAYYIRYVGIPHAEIMSANKYCLEEYLAFIKNFSFENSHYEYTSENGDAYEIYYVSAENAEDLVNVPVPKEYEYSISGDNMNGFIVTVKK